VPRSSICVVPRRIKCAVEGLHCIDDERENYRVKVVGPRPAQTSVDAEIIGGAFSNSSKQKNLSDA
jgi:hypothetical protein